MNTFHIVAAHHPDQIEASQTLRYALLRQPWGQPLEPDTRPPTDDLVGVLDGAIVATGRIQLLANEREAQVRGMTVAPEFQGRGFGRRMLQALESCARGRGCDAIVLNARTTAVAFYAKAGYQDQGPGPTLFDAIPHRRMLKPIDHADYQPWGLHLRAAVDADGPALQRLIFGCLAEFGMQPEHDGIDQDLEALQATYAGGAFWVATDTHDRVVASVGMLALPSPGHYELRRMYLAAEQRGRGLGRALLGTALNWAYHQQARYLELETATVLESARHLYTWAGFQPVSGELETRRCDQRMGMRLGAAGFAAA